MIWNEGHGGHAIMTDLPDPAEKMQLPMPDVGFTSAAQAWAGQLRSDAVNDSTNVSPEVLTMEGLIPQDRGKGGAASASVTWWTLSQRST